MDESKNNFETDYQEYYALSRLDRKGLATMIQQQRRLELRNKISNLLIAEDPRTKNLVTKATSSRKFWGKTYAEISSETTDGNAFGKNERRESSLVETIANTALLKDIASEVIEMIKPYADVIILFGSYAYSLNFNIKNISDLDFQLLIENPNFGITNLPFFSDFKEELRTTLECFYSSDADNFGMKTFYRGKQLSFHFAKPNLLTKVCQANFLTPYQTVVKEFRIKPRRDGFQYDSRYTFDGTEYSWNCCYEETTRGLYTSLPLFEIDEVGRYVNGFFIDRFIVCSPVAGDLNYAFKNTENLKMNLVKRLVYEESQGIVQLGSANLYKILARHRYFSDSFKKKILNDELINRQMLNSINSVKCS
ncbi:hypothetical protein [Coleofasciculus sp. H7-2]|uniref:hypothetical protein n=1 Tax=Coleofasciculus sp. H7-2 TaxID=3351545 RepID=UPI0036734792